MRKDVPFVRTELDKQMQFSLGNAMKITRVEATPLYIELNIDILGINKTNGLSLVLVEVETDGGLLGHGITAIMDEDVVASAVNDLAGPTIIGENPMANERIWEKLYWQLTPRADKRAMADMR